MTSYYKRPYIGGHFKDQIFAGVFFHAIKDLSILQVCHTKYKFIDGFVFESLLLLFFSCHLNKLRVACLARFVQITNSFKFPGTAPNQDNSTCRRRADFFVQVKDFFK